MKCLSHYREGRVNVAAIAAASLSGEWPDDSDGGSMNATSMTGSPGPPGCYGFYHKPELECLGTLRELTQSGGAAFSDLWTTDVGAGCRLTSSSTYTCIKPV